MRIAILFFLFPFTVGAAAMQENSYKADSDPIVCVKSQKTSDSVNVRVTNPFPTGPGVTTAPPTSISLPAPKEGEPFYISNKTNPSTSAISIFKKGKRFYCPDFVEQVSETKPSQYSSPYDQENFVPDFTIERFAFLKVQFKGAEPAFSWTKDSCVFGNQTTTVTCELLPAE